MARRGLFITFEGGEGVGKSTQIRILTAWLKSRGKKVVLTLEPGGSRLGKKIREILLNPKHRQLSHRAELLLYEADRAQHVDTVIEPALKAGKVVVSDRYADSSTIYQGFCRGLGVQWTENLNAFATNRLKPDITLILDLHEKVGLDRVKRRLKRDQALKGVRRAVKMDRLEREKADFHVRVRKGFQALSRREPRRVYLVDASGPVDEVAARIRKLVSQKMVR